MDDHTCGLCDNGRYYYGERIWGPCFNCEEATADMRPVLRLLYETDTYGHLGAYGMKHDVEDVLGRYVPTEELVRAAQVAFMTRVGDGDVSSLTRTDDAGRTIGFHVKPRFPLTWLWNKVTTRPKGAKTAQWDAYQAVLAETQRRASLPAPPTEVSVTASGSQ